MTDGILLDTHICIWLSAERPIQSAAQALLAEARVEGKLFLSDISLWELGVALHKKNFETRPDLGGLGLSEWVRRLSAQYAITSVRVSQEIAFEAALVPGMYGSGDPGDCFLIATARIRNLTLATRDAKILALATRQPDYLSVISC